MKKIFLILIFFIFSPANIIIIKTQNPKSSVDHNPIPRLLDSDECSSQIIDYLNGIYLSDELISDLVKNNFSKILEEPNSNKVLNYISDEYLFLVFKNKSCLSLIQNNVSNTTTFQIFNISYNLTEDDYIQLLIQTNKNFILKFYAENGNLISSDELNINEINISANVYDSFRNSINEYDYQLLSNYSVNIFNPSEQFFNDICEVYESGNETKTPYLRFNEFYYKNNIRTYPLEASYCSIISTNASYENKNISLTYNCAFDQSRNISLLLSKEANNTTSIITKKYKSDYDGPHSLTDQRKILKCYNETFKKDIIEINVGSYVSMILIFFALICLFFLIFRKFDLRPIIIDETETVDNKRLLRNGAPPKVRTLKNIDIDEDDPSSKKIMTGRKKIIKDDDYNLDSDEGSTNVNYNTKKKRKKRRNKSTENVPKENYDYEEKNYNTNISTKIKKSGNMKQENKLRRLVIITNLGDSSLNIHLDTKLKDELGLNYSDYFSNNDATLDNKEQNIQENQDNEKLQELGGIIVGEDKEKNAKLNKLKLFIGKENNTFLSNIKRDYLKYEDAAVLDTRKYNRVSSHFIKMKQDFINLFCCKYSLVHYELRVIKFLFFFHFLFYLQTLCVGQKYYFVKYYSTDYSKYKKDWGSEYNEKEFYKFQYMYAFKYAFPRVLIPAAISLISYVIAPIFSPRRRILKIVLYKNMKGEVKRDTVKYYTKRYKIVYIVFSILAILLMVFFYYSLTNYFYVFKDAIYEIPVGFVCSGVVRFVFDLIFWAIVACARVQSVKYKTDRSYKNVRGTCELN